DGEFGPGPDGEFGPGPDGEFGPGPDGEFGPVPGGDPLDFATGGEDFAGGPDGDFGPSPGGPGFDDFGPAPGGPGFDDFGPGPGGPGFDDFGPAPGGPGFDDFGSGPGGPPPMDLFYAGDPNMAPEGTFVFGDGFFEAGGDPFFVGIPGPDQYGPDGSFDQFGPGPGPGTGGDFGPAPNSLDPGSVPPPGPGGDFGPGPGGPGYDDFGPGPGGPGFDDFGFGPGPGGPGFDDFGFGPGPGGPGFDDFGFGPGPGGPGFDDFGFGPGPGGPGFDDFGFGPGPGMGGDYYDPMAGGTYYEPAFAYYDPYGGGIYYDNHVIQDIQQDQIVFEIIDDNASPLGSGSLRFTTPGSFSRFENDNTPLIIPFDGGVGPPLFSVASASDVVDGAGEDSLLFEIDPSTGELFRAGFPNVSLDFETPLDVLADNIYKLTLTITDGVDTVTQDFAMAVQNLPLMVGSRFENNIGVTDNGSPGVLDTFQQFGSQEAFLAAMSDGTLTWNVTYGSGAARVCQGGGLTCIKLDAVNLVVKTLGRTIDFDVTGGFENMKISAFEEATGRFNINITETNMTDFSGLAGFVPGKFTVSSGALPGAVTAQDVNITADFVNGLSVGSRDVSGQLDLVVEAQIGASSSATDDFTAVVNTLIKDVDQVSTSMSVGIGQPTVTP
ncbi:MAG: cadherin repeat domain-containing protein, partial [Proteobacteria bacterium]|nr:cadherin repeat domain-containing protein [Pseudomonadota bacterium]